MILSWFSLILTIRVFKELPKNDDRILGIRIDSGDITYLTKKARNPSSIAYTSQENLKFLR